MRKIISVILVLSMTIICAVPSMAVPALPGGTSSETLVSNGTTYNLTGLGDFFIHAFDTVLDAGETVSSHVRSWFDDSICPNNLENHRHSFVAQHTQVGSDFGNYYVCEYCRQTAGEVLDTAYTDYVGTLPSTNYNSNGWLPVTNWGIADFPLNGGDRSTVLNFDGDRPMLHTYNRDGRASYATLKLNHYFGEMSNCSLTLYYDRNVYMRGLYSSFPRFVLIYQRGDSWYTAWEITFNDSTTYSGTGYQSVTRSFANGDKLYLDIDVQVRFSDGSSVGSDAYIGTFKPFYYTLDTSEFQNIISTTYNVDSRPSSITGDFGIMGENNQLTKIDTQTIINEGDHSVYNPVTGDTETYESYDYDYSTRSYNLTLTGGTTETVTYGDNNITIEKGGQTYNVYYLVEEPEPETPAEHTHKYVGTVTREPTCTLGGIKTYTCSECNDFYTQSIPNLGHDWIVKDEVLTEYDENGEVLTQGYTIYKCSRCGEERRSDDGTAPPSGAGGNDGGLISTDDNTLQVIRNKLLSIFSGFPEAFGELTNFLEEAFPYIPDDIMNMITFSVGVSVIMAFFKFFWR